MRLPPARYSIPASLLVLLLVLLLAAPGIARHLLVTQLSERLQVAVAIENVALNLFTGEARIDNLVMAAERDSSLRSGMFFANIDMTALFRGKLVAEAIHLDGLRLQVVEGADGQPVIVIPLLPTDDAEPPADATLPLFRLAEFRLTNGEIDIALKGATGRLTVSELLVANLATEQGAVAQLSLAGDWDGAPLTLRGDITPFAESPAFDGEFSLQRAELTELDAYLPENLAGLGGTADLTISGRVGTDRVEIQGELELNGPAVGLKHLEVFAQSITWRGAIDATDLSGTPAVRLGGSVEAAGLRVADNSRNVTLFELGGLSMADLQIDQSGALKIGQLAFDELRAVDRGSEENRLLFGRRLVVNSLDYHDNTLDVGVIEADTIMSTLYITAERDLVSRGVLTASLDALRESGDTGDIEEEAPPLIWRVEGSKARNVNLTVVDQLLDPPFRLKLVLSELEMGALDSQQPGLAMPLDLKAQVGEFSEIALSGHISALTPGHDTALKGHIDSLPLPLLSQFVENMLGYELVAGQYDHDFDIQVVDSHITATNELNLRKLRVRKVEDADPTAPLPMPLGFALDLVRDSDDHIELSVPLDGQLDDADVGLDQIISKALGNALRSGSTAFLKFALQPYGAIWMGAEAGLKFAGKMRLDPMMFDSGSATLGPAQKEYADKLATILLDRPGIHLELCGEAGREDYRDLLAAATDAPTEPPPGEEAPVMTQENRTQLAALAEARSNALKSWLVNDKGVDRKRLYPCKPKVDPEGNVNGIRLSL